MMRDETEIPEAVVTEIPEAVVVVGCGGLLFQALPSLALQLRGRMERGAHVFFVDGDKVEEHNGARQWGAVGEWKVMCAWEAFVELVGLFVDGGVDCGLLGNVNVGACQATPVAAWMREAGLDNVGLGADATVRAEREMGRAKMGLVVLALTDTRQSRREALGWAWRWSAEHPEAEVMFVTAGNAVESGQAVGWRMAGSGAPLWDAARLWLRDDEVVEKEDRGRVSCGTMVEQTAMANQGSAFALARVLEGMRDRENVAWYWMTDENGRLVFWDDGA